MAEGHTSSMRRHTSAERHRRRSSCRTLRIRSPASGLPQVEKGAGARPAARAALELLIADSLGGPVRSAGALALELSCSSMASVWKRVVVAAAGASAVVRWVAQGAGAGVGIASGGSMLKACCSAAAGITRVRWASEPEYDSA